MEKSHWVSDLNWVRQTSQSRAQATQEKIFDSAEKLFATQGIADSSMSDIAKGANISIGGLYHHFKDKHTLILALYQRIYDDIHSLIELCCQKERWQGAKIPEIIRGVLEISFSLNDELPWRHRAKTAICEYSPELKSQHELIYQTLHKHLMEMMGERVDEVTHSNPAVALPFTLDLLFAVIDMHYSESFTIHSVECTNSTVIEETLTNLSSYLGLK